MKFISFSGGVESRTMAILFGKDANAIFADTKAEHEKLYEQLDDVEKKIRAFHENDFKIIRVTSKKHPEELIEYIKEKKYFPSFQQRFCTRIFKIEPIDDYLKQFESCELMIGLNYDEQELRDGNHGLVDTVTYSYPLIDNGITREMCHQILKAADIEPNFPAYMQRGGCKMCYYKSKKEYMAMALMNPKEFDEVAELEETIQDRRDKFFHIIDSIPKLKDFKRHAESVLFDQKEMYPVINNVTKCGVFCNR